MKSGGFDAIVGNPPYIRVQTLQEWAPFEAEYYKERYKAAASGNYDIYVCFVERGLEVLNRRGKLGFILPHKFFNARYGEGLRSLIAGGEYLSKVVHFGDQQVFEGATNYTCLLFLDKSGNKRFEYESVGDLNAWRETGRSARGKIPATKATPSEWNFIVGDGMALFEKLSKMPTKLGDVAERMAEGIRTSANEVYVLDLVSATRSTVTAYSKQLGRKVKLERKAISEFLQGREIKPYLILPSGKTVILPYEMQAGVARLVSPERMDENFPRAWAYLCANKRYLERREKGRFRGTGWYMYGRQQNIDLMLLPKILVPDIADRASFALDESGAYAFTSGYGITLRATVGESPKYLLGLLNSKLLDFYLKSVSTTMRGGFFRYFTQFIERLPIRTIDFSNAAEKARHDKMVALVDRMLEMNKKKHSGKLAPSELDRLEREIASTDHEIDELVYELYGITEAERKTIEGDRT
jgi:hypothetical protein